MRKNSENGYSAIQGAEKPRRELGKRLNSRGPIGAIQGYSGDSALGAEPWTGSGNRHGYGAIRDEDGRSRVVHRVAYEVWVGAIPDGLELDHLCGVRCCVNPAHLEPVTHYENLMRGAIGDLARRTRCKRGHEFTPENTVRNNRGRECRICRRETRQRRTSR